VVLLVLVLVLRKETNLELLVWNGQLPALSLLFSPSSSTFPATPTTTTIVKIVTPTTASTKPEQASCCCGREGVVALKILSPLTAAVAIVVAVVAFAASPTSSVAIVVAIVFWSEVNILSLHVNDGSLEQAVRLENIAGPHLFGDDSSGGRRMMRMMRRMMGRTRV
jgi:hypothetical protein